MTTTHRAESGAPSAEIRLPLEAPRDQGATEPGTRERVAVGPGHPRRSARA
jgi:hypothetical protein